MVGPLIGEAQMGVLTGGLVVGGWVAGVGTFVSCVSGTGVFAWVVLAVVVSVATVVGGGAGVRLGGVGGVGTAGKQNGEIQN